MQHHHATFVLTALLGSLAAQAPQHLVVPAAHANTDAPSYVWVPGASKDVREQTLVGGSHLTAVVGNSISAIEFRRTAANEIYQGGTANLTVTLSTSPNDPLTSSVAFADNVGLDAVQVFSGAVTIPTSPATVGPNVAWTNDNIIRIAFQQPFPYQGGTLCVDITGAKILGQTANWWMADAAFENLDGTVTQVGPGCGPFTNSQGQWSHVSVRSLVAGGYAEMWAYGPPGSFGIAILGHAAPAPIPLAPLGIGGPGCFAYLDAIYDTTFLVFAPQINPLVQHRGGRAEWRLRIPNQVWALGAELATQWLELSQMNASNGVRWIIATTIPTLDMALLDGVPTHPIGNLTVDMAHVLRFEHQ